DRGLTGLRPDLVRYPVRDQHGNRLHDTAVWLQPLLPKRGGAAGYHYAGYLHLDYPLRDRVTGWSGTGYDLPGDCDLPAQQDLRLRACPNLKTGASAPVFLCLRPAQQLFFDTTLRNKITFSGRAT